MRLIKNSVFHRQVVSIFGGFLAIFAVFSVVTFNFHGTPNQVGMILVSYQLRLPTPSEKPVAMDAVG